MRISWAFYNNWNCPEEFVGICFRLRQDGDFLNLSLAILGLGVEVYVGRPKA